MIERVLLVAWKGSTATQWVEHLETGGFMVLLEDTTGERAWRTAKERGIDLVVIDGQKKPSHGRQTGNMLRDTAKTKNIPIIWTNLDTEDARGVQDEVRPNLTLLAPTNATEALAAIQAIAADTSMHRPPDDDETDAVLSAALRLPENEGPPPPRKPMSAAAASKPPPKSPQRRPPPRKAARTR